MSQRIRTGVGAVEFVDVVVPRDQADAGYQVALGDQDTPGQWQDPTDVVVGDTSVTLRLLVGHSAYNPVAGYYWKWWRKTSAPQTFVRTSASDTVEIDTGAGIDVGTGIPWATVDDVADGDAETLAAAKAYTDQHAGGGGPGGGLTYVDHGNGTFTLSP